MIPTCVNWGDLVVNTYPEGQFDGTGNVLPGVLCLTCVVKTVLARLTVKRQIVAQLTNSHSNKFSAKVREDRSNHTLPNSSKSSSGSRSDVFVKRAWVVPISEPPTITIRTTKGDDQGEDDQTDDDEDFDRAQPELQLAEVLDPKNVDDDNHDQKDRDPYAWIDLFAR